MKVNYTELKFLLIFVCTISAAVLCFLDSNEWGWFLFFAWLILLNY